MFIYVISDQDQCSYYCTSQTSSSHTGSSSIHQYQQQLHPHRWGKSVSTAVVGISRKKQIWETLFYFFHCTKLSYWKRQSGFYLSGFRLKNTVLSVFNYCWGVSVQHCCIFTVTCMRPHEWLGLTLQCHLYSDSHNRGDGGKQPEHLLFP